MALELKRRIGVLLGPSRKRFFGDDFNWETYTRDKYGPQLQTMESEWDLQVDDRVRFDDETGKLETGTANLHPNSKTVYELVGRLGVKSAIEVGCGGGDHLRNLKKLYPNISVAGGDRSEGQLSLLAKRNPDVADSTSLMDITMPFSSHWPTAELVYSQAVIMHIKTAVSHLNGLANMFNMAERYVVLMENYGCHPLVDDILRLHEGGYLNWENVNFHAHHVDGKPYCLVVSREECSLPKLDDYFELPLARKIRY